MGTVIKCKSCGNSVNLTHSVIRVENNGFHSSPMVAVECPKCYHFIHPLHQGERQTWLAVYNGERV